jgi:hypothetical protein
MSLKDFIDCRGIATSVILLIITSITVALYKPCLSIIKKINKWNSKRDLYIDLSQNAPSLKEIIRKKLINKNLETFCLFCRNYEIWEYAVMPCDETICLSKLNKTEVDAIKHETNWMLKNELITSYNGKIRDIYNNERILICYRINKKLVDVLNKFKN